MNILLFKRTETTRLRDMFSNSQKIIGLIFLSFLIAGVFDACFPQAVDVNSFVHGFTIAVLLFVWCGFHADEEDIVIPRHSRLLCGLLGVIGVTIYLFRGFGFKKGGLKCLLGLFGLGISVAIYMGAFYVADLVL